MHLTLEPTPRAGKSVPASPRRRVLISGGLAAGGPQTHVPLLCSVLQQAGAEVTIAAASTNWSAGALADLRATGVRVVVSPFRFGPLRMLGKLWSFLAWPFLLRCDYDVLYCIGEGRMHFWAGRFARESGFKIYHEIVTSPAPGSVPAQVAARMNAVVANSENVAREMRSLLPNLPVRAIPFFTSDAPVAPPPARPPRTSGPLRVAFLGRLAPHKRPVELIEAVARWNGNASIGPVRLDLYGGDYDYMGQRLRDRITGLNLGDHVSLRGAYAPADLDRIFAETDLVLLPSLYEGLPLVLVEAMLRGVPVVATSAGGTAELGGDNPDVLVTEGTGWDAFEAGVLAMASRIRAGQIDPARLHAWTEARYGYQPVAAAWREALLSPRDYFAVPTPAEATA
ncbi:MAG TPA: glycosyltransferase family 4 protein [Candidatus Methylacidiphilales bacterium]|jgi:glycosyltransferase involved in cell wall biosynthesis|nr:glycosyltransferase family 4 protein [Candidatus Methylacidiphilales bacterium]